MNTSENGAESAREEPSYMMFARSNVRGGAMSSPLVVKSLLARIDRDASALKAAQPRIITTEDELHALRDGSAVSAAGDVHIKNGRWMDRLGEFSPAWLLLEMGVVTVVYEEPSGE